MNAPARDPAAIPPPATPRPDPPHLTQQLGIETPEHVAVHLELAGVGSRAAAALVDTVITTIALALLWWIVIATLIGGLGDTLTGWVLAAIVLLFVFGGLAYFVLLEALHGGRTLGKQLLGIRVVMETGHPLTTSAAVVRNVVRVIDVYFPLLPFIPGLLMVFLHRRNQRLGDMAAGTIVVRDRPVDWALGPAPGVPAAQADEPIEAGPPELSEDEFRLLDRFLARADQLDPTVQVRLATELARRFEDRLTRRTADADADAYLVALHAEEQRKRRSRFGTRTQAGTAGRTTVTAERFVAHKRDRWEAFHALATRVERAGVGALAPGEIPGFAARYRELAADLARARTYGVDPRVIEYLERVVSAGHNALYRTRGRRRTPALRYLLRDFPAAVVLSWRYVGAAFLLFVVPAVAGYTMIRRQPGLADEVLPALMISRAERAAENQARGVGYAEDEQRAEALPVVAATLMGHNIWIAFQTFAGGLLAGTLTVFALVTNGLVLGVVLALFANYHAAGYLLTFVAAHGVLELTAIFIAGGAGFRLAGALLVPGDRTRKDALVVEGRMAARMIGAVVFLLALAGTIEGLLSASDAPPAFKYAVSATTAALLVLYLWSGWTYLKTARTARDHDARASRAIAAP